jgi:hypothetical protein
MGSLYKRRGSKNYAIAVVVGGRQICRSTHAPNKRLAEKMRPRWETEVFEGRLQLIKTNAPIFEQWAAQFLQTKANLKTRSRYSPSINNVKPRFGKLRLPQITLDCIEDLKGERLASALGLRILAGIWR